MTPFYGVERRVPCRRIPFSQRNMWTIAGTPRLTFRQTPLCWLVFLFLTLLLTGCGSDSTTRPVLAQRCMQVSGHHESSVSILSPDEGTLRLRVEERGISVVVTLDEDPSSAAESPVERLGTIDLVTYTQRGQSHSITVQAQDSPDIVGEFCVQANLIAVSDHKRVLAETAFATAGRATHSHDWDAAFDEYLRAARHFDDLGARRSSGAARQAMAEIAYLRLGRTRDSYALASQALADY